MDDDGVPKPDTTTSGSFSTGAAMDLDFMDELLYDGCWLETTDGFTFSPSGLPSSSMTTSPLRYFSFIESTSSLANTNPNQKLYQVTENNHPDNTSLSPRDYKVKKLAANEPQNHSSAIKTIPSLVQNESLPIGVNELSRRVWIGPRAEPGLSSSVKKRLLDAIKFLQQYAVDAEVLVQIWVPTKKGGKRVLTTIDQPNFLGLKSESLKCYRDVSENYLFSLEGDSKDFLGLPGRVFLGRLPESTPDVRFFKIEEYPRKDYANKYNISGSLAVPVFERGTRTCLGVVEVVTTSQNINYRPELETICKALEAVDLRSSHDFIPPSIKACKEFCQAVVPEISEILESVCKKHKLPLALTWARCFQQGKGGCQHFDEKFANCISTVDSACFVADQELLVFHVACSEQYLFLGQGIVGKAFITQKQCFAADIAEFSKTDYPLSHHAKILDLHAAVAIPLRSSNAGSVDFVLELFLPKDCRDAEEQQKVWDSLPFSIQQACQNLHIVMEKDLEEDISWQSSVVSNERPDKQVIHQFSSLPLKEPSSEGSSWITQMMEAQQKGKNTCVSWDSLKEPKEEFTVATHWDDTAENLHQKHVFNESGKLQQNSGSKDIAEGANNIFSGQHSSGIRRPGEKRPGEKRRTKTEKMISLEVLRQYFAGSLKDAAKNLGVCPTTLKRICRQHGITRWPSRKLKKVGHSLKKLQLVIDSVQGAEGSIQIGSFYTTFPELTSPNFHSSSASILPKINGDIKPSDPQPENTVMDAGVAAAKSPSSSSSQSSGSSTCCSIEEKDKISNILPTGDASPVEDPSGILKRTRSDAELHNLNNEESKPIVRSQSHKVLLDNPNADTLPAFTKGSGRISRDSNTFRVKANFGEDKVRFSLQPNWDFKYLQQELGKRFNIQDFSRTDLKYLDDDQEWVLLTCDADLEECKDIYRVSQSHTIKISMFQALQPPQQLGGD